MIIAGTGAGKTLPFAMPLLADRTGKSKVIIVSTLNALEQDQVCLSDIQNSEIFDYMRALMKCTGCPFQQDGSEGSCC